MLGMLGLSVANYDGLFKSTWLQQGERHGGERLDHNVVVHVSEGMVEA